MGALNDRSQEIFRHIVETYCETGGPVGSHTLSHRLESSLSSATIRNVMANLEQVGLLYSPHTSAGRLPTDSGLRFFVNGLLEAGHKNCMDDKRLRALTESDGRSLDEVLEEAIQILSNLSQCAGIVFAPKSDVPLKHVEFVRLSLDQALVVLVAEGGLVENRVIDVPKTLPNEALNTASNYLTNKLAGYTLSDVKKQLIKEMEVFQKELDSLSAAVVSNSLGVIRQSSARGGTLIIKGQAHLLNDATRTDMEKLRRLFSVLEERTTVMKLVDAAIQGEGVQIFIGSENELFDLTGSSLIISSYQDEGGRVVGAIGVIGPSHLNYGRIIPMVDYTSRLIGKLIGKTK